MTPKIADDDDAEPIFVGIGSLPDETQVWLEHPASAGLKYYRDRKCTEEIPLSSGQPHVVGGSVEWPDDNIVFVRAESVNFPDAANPQVEGDLKLMIKVGGAANGIEATKMKLTIIKELGAKKYFHGARDYIGEHNARIFVRDKGYGSNTSFRIISMREEATRMYPIDAARRASGTPLKGIDQVNTAFDGTIHVAVNGNMNYFSDDTFNSTLGNIAAAAQGLITDKCHGRIVRMNAYDSAVSSDNTDSNTSPAGSDLAGEQYGRYVAQYNQQNKFVFAAGRVPLASPSPDQPLGGPSAAMGGLSTNYSSSDRLDREYQFIGYAKVMEENQGIVFTATQLTGTGSGPELKEDAKRSGVATLPGGNAGDLQILLLDGGTSTAVSHVNPDDALSTRVKKSKHTGLLYYINTYLLFHCEKPRQQ